MENLSCDVAVLEPQCLFELVPRARELGISGEEANQRDIDESRSLMATAYLQAFEKASRGHGVQVRLEFHPFVPDEVAGSGRGGAVSGGFELITLIMDSNLPADIAANLIADGLADAAKGVLALARRQGIERKPEKLSRYTPTGILALCGHHALRLNPGSEVEQIQMLKSPSATSMSPSVTVIIVGLPTKEITYVIGRDGEPHAIVETNPKEIRLLSTNEWREWYLSEDDATAEHNS